MIIRRTAKHWTCTIYAFRTLYYYLLLSLFVRDAYARPMVYYNGPREHQRFARITVVIIRRTTETVIPLLCRRGQVYHTDARKKKSIFYYYRHLYIYTLFPRPLQIHTQADSNTTYTLLQRARGQKIKEGLNGAFFFFFCVTFLSVDRHPLQTGLVRLKSQGRFFFSS